MLDERERNPGERHDLDAKRDRLTNVPRRAGAEYVGSTDAHIRRVESRVDERGLLEFRRRDFADIRHDHGKHRDRSKQHDVGPREFCRERTQSVE